MNRKCRMLYSLMLCALVACSGGGGNDATGNQTGGGGGGGGGGSGACDDGAVCVLSGSFSPADLTVAKNASVSWIAKTGTLHNIVFDSPLSPGVSDIGEFSAGTVSRNFSTVGTFPYHCTIHAGMKGTIKVQ